MLINLCAVVLIMIHGVEGLSLKQPQKVLIKVKGKTVSFKCEVTDLGSNNFVHWYHKKVGGTFKRLLYISDSGVASSEASDFVSEKIGNSYGIKLKEIKEEHAGMYYCASWESSHTVLGVSLDQGSKAVAKAEGKTVNLPCKATDLSSSDYIHWYQIKDGKAPSRLLYISKDGVVTRDSNNPQASDFTVDKTKLYNLKLSDTKKSHSAVYFCAYWDTSSGHTVLGVSVDQGSKAVAKAEGKTVYLPCKATGLSSSNYIHWYQIKDGKAPSRLLYISKDGAVTRDSNNPQASDFTVDKTKLYNLKLSDTKKSHSAVYFCAYWEWDSSYSHNCLNGQNIPTHPERVMIKPRGRAARIKCHVDPSTLKSSPLHWYRAQSGGAFQRLMYFEAGSTKAIIDQGVPRRYAGSVSGKEVSLTISSLQFDDAGSYYCALWTGDTTVLTVRGNHYKNLLSESKRFYVEQQQQQGGDMRNIF
ncbi:Immunoglobulin lambda variable 1-36 [Anabarilius grahami]|nr:Immunoglobulin lambda variable 1-36 [Anabarilius grahami]